MVVLITEDTIPDNFKAYLKIFYYMYFKLLFYKLQPKWWWGKSIYVRNTVCMAKLFEPTFYFRKPEVLVIFLCLFSINPINFHIQKRRLLFVAFDSNYFVSSFARIFTYILINKIAAMPCHLKNKKCLNLVYYVVSWHGLLYKRPNFRQHLGLHLHIQQFSWTTV